MIISVREYEKIIFFEEGIISGGIGEHFSKELLEYGFKGEYHVKGISKFIKHRQLKALWISLASTVILWPHIFVK